MSQTSTGKSDCEFANGAREIGAVIGKNESQTYHLLRMGFIRCARKVGNQHICDIPTLKREFGAQQIVADVLSESAVQTILNG